MDGFTRVLKDPILNLNHLINEFAVPLYFEELKIDRCDIDVRLYYILVLFYFYSDLDYILIYQIFL